MVTDNPAQRHAEFLAAITAARDALDAFEARATDYRDAFLPSSGAMKGYQRDAYERRLVDLKTAAFREATDAVSSISDAIVAWWPATGRSSWYQ